MTPPIELEEAQARLLSLVQPLSGEIVPVGDAQGRYLVEAMRARRTQPSADLSAMDGYAVAGDGPWTIIGESRAGHPFDQVVSPGRAIRISTGAMMPQGADTVLIQENATREGQTLICDGDAPPPGRHVRRRGLDFEASDTLLKPGSLVGPAAIALALTAGHATLLVGRKPHVTVIDCGDELAADPTECADNQIPASNGAMLSAMAAQVPCTVDRIGPIPDQLEALVEALKKAGNSDLIVTSGGASVGDHDLVRPALEAAGGELDFWRVAMKPGKPLLVARMDRTVVLGLPGNPVSAYVTAYLLMLPFLRALSGCGAPLPQSMMLPLAAPMGPGGSRREFVRARYRSGAVEPIAMTDSSALHALASANALIDRPAQASEAKAGTSVPVYLLENGGNA